MRHSIVAEDGMKVSYKLPPGIKGFRYAPNHHYVELEDDENEVLHMPAGAVMLHYCKPCAFEWWTSSNRSSFCPVCASPDIGRRWYKPQLAFIPEKESKFKAPTPSLAAPATPPEEPESSE